MTISSLPLKLSIGIRDFWDNADSDVSRAKAALKKSLGLDTRIVINWGIIVDELDELYDDHRVLASSMAGFAAAWLTAFTALAEAEKETLGRQVVDRLLGLGKHLNVDFKVSRDASEAKTAWNELTGRFTLTVPRRQVLCPFESIPVFTQQLTQTFEPDLDVSDGETAQTPAEPSVVKDPQPPRPSEPAIFTPQPEAVQSVLEEPKATTPSLPRLDDLLQAPPYYLTLTQAALTVDVTCSHSQSLVLLEKYLKQGAFEVKLQDCRFRQGQFDRLNVDASVSLPVLAAVVERVLGYELKHSCGSWTFVRTTELE